MKPISTRAHGVLDYVAVVLVFALPRLLGWGPALTQMMTFLAGGALLYSLLTRYELGLIRVLPIPVHLVLDALVGLFFLVEAARLHGASTQVRVILAVLGLMELGAALLTQTRQGAQNQKGIPSGPQTRGV